MLAHLFFNLLLQLSTPQVWAVPDGASPPQELQVAAGQAYILICRVPSPT